MVPGNVLGVRAMRGVGGPDRPGLDCPAPPPALWSAAGGGGGARAAQTMARVPGRRRLCPERGAGARPAWRRERAALLCPGSCWWSRRRARGRMR